MSMTTRLIMIGAAVLAVIGATLAYNEHERELGALSCKMSDMVALAAQNKELLGEINAYKAQLAEADQQHAIDSAALATAAAHPVVHLLCHAANDSGKLPGVPAEASSRSAASGNTDPVRQRDFDPGESLANLSAGYERRVETARDALNRWPVPVAK